MADPARVALALVCDIADPLDARTWQRDGCPLTLAEMELLADFTAEDMASVVEHLRTDLEITKDMNLEWVREVGRLCRAALERMREDPNWLV